MARSKKIPQHNPYAVKRDADKVLRYMALRGPITRLHAHAEFGIQGITARITDLRDLGYDISTERCVDENGRPFSRWHLSEQNKIDVLLAVDNERAAFEASPLAAAA